jgi:hypothetical protein
MLGRELGLKLTAQALSGGLWLSAGALVALSDTRRRALHDRVVDTVVVREARSRRPRRDSDQGGVQRGGPMAPLAVGDQMARAESNVDTNEEVVGDAHAGGAAGA